MAEQDQFQLGDEEAFRLDLAASLPDERTKVLADVLEALVGAVAVQDGLERAGAAFAQVVLPPQCVVDELADGRVAGDVTQLPAGGASRWSASA